MKENVVKAALTGCFGALCIYIGELIVPVIVLAVVMLVDYCSGLAKAWMTGEVSSRIGIRGIIKKIGYLVVVAIGMIVDWLIKYGVSALGTDFEIHFVFALPVIIWLIINECISILENVSLCGAPIPKFLMKAIGILKDKVEEDKNSEDN